MLSIKTSSNQDHEVKVVTGTHLFGYSNDDVTYFLGHEKSINFFPKNLEFFFRNLRKIAIYPSNITTIEKTNLQPFSQLNFLYIPRSNLQVIRSDLFEFNLNLEEVYLYENNIKYVEKGAFDKLSKLRYLHFYGNPCFSGLAQNRYDVLTLINHIQSECNNKWVQIQETTTKTPSTTVGFEQEIEKLLAEIGKLKKDLQDVSIIRENEASSERIEIMELKEKNQKLEMELATCISLKPNLKMLAGEEKTSVELDTIDGLDEEFEVLMP